MVSGLHDIAGLGTDGLMIDSLSKANFFLENMIDLAEKPLFDREIQYLLAAPQNDGGE